MTNLFEEFKEAKDTHYETTDKEDLEKYLALMSCGEQVELTRISSDMVDLAGDSETGKFFVTIQIIVEGNIKE